MRHPLPADDESLLDVLRDALGEVRAVPAALVRAGQQLYAVRDLDLELARLAHDSTLDHRAGLRAEEVEGATVRDVTFESRSLVISLQLVANGAQGQVVDVANGRPPGGGPGGPGTVQIRPADGEPVTATIGEHGWFAFDTVPRGRVQLLCRTAGGVNALTAAITI